ncbi:MAG: cyclic nucleotide-binding domain-containing protein [Myxococcota bacterium]
MLEQGTRERFDIAAAASLLLGARSTARVAADQLADVYSKDFAGPLPGELRDLSVDGACIALRAGIAIDSVKSVSLRLPRGRLDLEATGRWYLPSDTEGSVLTGISFNGARDAEARKLNDFVLNAAREQAEFLGECDGFSDLCLDDLMNIAQASRYRCVPHGKCIYRQGTNSPRDRSVFLIKEGSVSLVHRVHDARNVELTRLGRGGVFGGGGLPLIVQSPNVESAIAAQRTVLIEITGPSFDYLRVARPIIGYRVISVVAEMYAARVARLLERFGSAL